MSTMPARVIHTTIERPWHDVYAYAANPEKMPRWAAGLAAGLKRDGDDWIGDGGPIGAIRVRFAAPNDFGVIDHTVTLENGARFENALRAVPNGDGAEVMFTLLRAPDMDDAAFERDAAAIAEDLARLKALLESDSGKQ
jgi:hypothetical protein